MAKRQCRIDDDDSDDLLAVYIAAAQAGLDGPGGWLGRAVGVQTLELRLDSFPTLIWPFGLDWNGWDDGQWESWAVPGRFSTVPLPYPPLISVTSVTYEDLIGALDMCCQSTGTGRPFAAISRKLAVKAPGATISP